MRSPAFWINGSCEPGSFPVRLRRCSAAGAAISEGSGHGDDWSDVRIGSTPGMIWIVVSCGIMCHHWWSWNILNLDVDGSDHIFLWSPSDKFNCLNDWQKTHLGSEKKSDQQIRWIEWSMAYGILGMAQVGNRIWTPLGPRDCCCDDPKDPQTRIQTKVDPDGGLTNMAPFF